MDEPQKHRVGERTGCRLDFSAEGERLGRGSVSRNSSWSGLSSLESWRRTICHNAARSAFFLFFLD